jgi:hypothetical protein
MSSIVDADDAVVEAARTVLAGDSPQGMMNVRRVERDDGTAFLYRVDPSVDAAAVEDVRLDGEFPDADVVLWRADHDLVEREVERRHLRAE